MQKLTHKVVHFYPLAWVVTRQPYLWLRVRMIITRYIFFLEICITVYDVHIEVLLLLSPSYPSLKVSRNTFAFDKYMTVVLRRASLQKRYQVQAFPASTISFEFVFYSR